MDRDQVIRILRENAEELHEMGLAKLYLFGSLARGEPKPADIDLAFEIGGNPHFSLLTQVGAIVRIEELLGRPVDLVQRERLHPRIKARVEAEMMEVF
jgi:predicted nucleotidyltransferase